MKRVLLMPWGCALSILVTTQLGCSSSSSSTNDRGGSGGQSGDAVTGNRGGTSENGGASNRGGSSGSPRGGESGQESAAGDGYAGHSPSAGAGNSDPTSSRGGAAGGKTSGQGGRGQGDSGVNAGGTTSAGGMTNQAGKTGSGGAVDGGTVPGDGGGACTSGDCGATVTAYPALPGATESPLYKVTANGTPLFVEKMTKFSPEMQVHYAHASLAGAGTATISVTVNETFSSYKLSPTSRKLAATKTGNTLTFSTGPNYLILQIDSKELLFILLDSEESDPPKLGDANVKNIADYGVDNTGAALVTSKVQSAIDAASGAAQNVLYFPPGKYKVGELWLKSNMTMYLAGGAVLYGSSSTSDFNTGSGGINIEGMQHSIIRMYQIKNAKILGRGVIDSNGKAIRAAGLNASLLKIEQSSNVLVDGILVRDSSYWNTLIYRSDAVTILNYKVINCRPTTTTYNNTDGVDFDESTNGKLSNAFLYTGDDGMATKNEESSNTVNTKDVLHEHIVVYNNSVGCKVGTKSMGQTMSGIQFKDVDVVKAGRALTIEAYDTAVVQDTTFEDIRVEAADSMFINLALDQPPDWRDAANTTIIKDTYFTNISSDVKQVINLHGKSSSVNVTGVHFKNLTVKGKTITSQTDSNASWSINSYVSGITFE